MVSDPVLPLSGPDWIDPVTAFRVFAHEPMSLLLHGGGQGAQGRYSYLFIRPVETLIEADAAQAGDRLKHALERESEGYWAGLMAYEMSPAFEPRLNMVMPNGDLALAMGRYEAVAIFDHLTHSIAIEGQGRVPEDLKSSLSQHYDIEPDPISLTRSLTPVWDDDTYLAAARQARDYVAAGDIFQVNLSHRFEGAVAGDGAPYTVFERLTRQSPAGYAAYLNIDENRVIVTNSPEQFLSVDPSGRITTRPIKGTRPRGSNPAEDRHLREALEASAKDRAENLMIVDLMRNDLSRVCEPGSVKVPGRIELESYANVHHLVSTITGQTRSDMSRYDILAACFPPGSITGAPKIRAMEIISELEGEARGAYCGAMGWFGPDRQIRLNVMIRTLGFTREEGGWSVSARSGGAITIDSDPAEELAETHAKLAALKSVLEMP